MKKYVYAFLKNLTTALEFVIALILAAGIILMTFQLVLSFGNLADLSKYPNYDDLLTTCFNLIIGVEMIRMLYLHTPMTVFEVLLFAIARQCDHRPLLTGQQPARCDLDRDPVCHKKVFVCGV